jgi:hypothetical protein
VTAVRLADRRIWVGDESRPLLSGEIHYWRLEPDAWREALLAAKRMGLEIVSTYVPWEFHELARGSFDFDGQTNGRCDVGSFLHLAAELGLWVIIRPGPYIYAEWQNQGVPDRVAHLHRLHPAFQDEAGTWIAAVSATMRPWLATNGGPIVMCQADNEIDPCYAWHGAQIGIYDAPAELTAGGAAGDGAGPAGEFTYDYVRRYLAWVAGEYRRNGVDVPLSANTYPDFAVQPRAVLLESVDLVGSDCYPSDGFAREPNEHQRFLELVRYLRVASDLPYLAEFGAGVWHGQHYHTGVHGPRHYVHAAASAIVAGTAGWNWYMLVNRDNWYGAPINERGRERGQLTDAFGEAVQLFRTLDPPSLQKVTNTAATFWLPDHRDARLQANWPVLKALHEAGIDYEFFDPELARVSKPILFYSGTGRLSRTGHEALRAYIQSGGWLVLFQSAPMLDETGAGLNLLELERPAFITPGWGVRLELDLDGVRFMADGPIQGFRSPPGEPIVGRRVVVRDPEMAEFDRLLALEAGQELVVGYRRRMGQGGLLHLGLAPTTEAILAAHAAAGVEIPLRASPAGATAALFRRSDGSRLALAVHDGRAPPAAMLHLPDRHIAVEFVSRPYAVVELD